MSKKQLFSCTNALTGKFILVIIYLQFIRNLQFVLERIVFVKKYSAVESKLAIEKKQL